MLIDTHAHLSFPDYDRDLDQVVERSQATEVTKIICASSNMADSKKAIEIAQKYPGVVFASIGLHPQQTDPDNPDSIQKQIEKLVVLAKNKEVVAIGECGLDYSPAPPGEKDRPKKDQALLFEEQIKIAIKLKLPILIHSRKAFADTVEIVSRYRVARGVFHCYAGGKKGIAKVLEMDFYFGVDGNLTYDEGLQSVFKLIPLEKIILETDCPFLTPEPFRNQRNEPGNILLIAKKLAKIKNISLEEVAKTTTTNAKKLFKI